MEVKCPFCIKDTSISEAVKKGVLIWLEQSTDRLKLKRNRPTSTWSFRIYAFVAWTTQDMQIERIEADHLFFESQLKVANAFYISGILWELLFKWHTRSNAIQSKDLHISGQELFCCCRCGSEESLVLSCGNLDCIRNFA